MAVDSGAEDETMKVRKVKEIQWSGVDLTSWSILREGALSASSLVAAPSLYLLTRAQASKEGNFQKASAEDPMMASAP